MAVGMQRIGFLIAVVFLALSSGYTFWVAYTQRDWQYAVAGVLSAVACIGTARSARWSRYLVYLLTAAFLGTWSYSIYDAVRAGFYGNSSAGEIAWSLLPESLLLGILCLCSYVVFAHARAAPRPS